MIYKPGFTSFHTLSTECLVLRKLTINDAIEIMILRSDEKVNKFMLFRISGKYFHRNQFFLLIQ